MADGFQGPGFFDAQGNWVNGIPGETTINRTINTPLSSSGQPAYFDPSATVTPNDFATPQGGQVATRPQMTPNSSNGAAAPGVRNVPATIEGGAESTESLISKMRSVGGRLGAGMTGASVLAAPAMQGPNAFGGDVQTQMNNAKASDDADRDQFYRFFSGFGAAPATPMQRTATAPATQTAPNAVRPGAPPVTTGLPPPPITLPPFNVPPPPGTVQAPIPNFPITGGGPPLPPRRPGAPNLGYGVPQQPAAAPQAPSSMFTTIDRPNADVAGGRSVAGQLAPQYFNQAREPGGPAQMGALDLSGLFNHPAVAAQAAAHPAVQGAMASNIAQSQAAPRARAPVVQQQPGYVYPRQNAPMPSRTPSRGNPFDLFGTVT